MRSVLNFLLTVPALAHEGEMVGPQSKAVLSVQTHREISEHFIGDLEHGPTHSTRQMLMAIRAQVVGRWPVTEVHVLDYAQLLQGEQGPVDR